MIVCELDAILTSRGLKGKWLAEQVGVSPGTVSLWNTNKQIPKLDTAYKVAEVLGLEVTKIWISVTEK